MEMYFNLYVYSNDNDIGEKYERLLDAISEVGGEEWGVVNETLGPIVVQIDPDKGAIKLKNFIKKFDDVAPYSHKDFGLSDPGIARVNEKVLKAHWVFGSYGDEAAPAIVEFIGSLSDKGDVRGYLKTDEEPSDYFYRYEDQRVKEKYYEPFKHYKKDIKALKKGVYAWWHDGLPGVFEGYLNDFDLSWIEFAFDNSFQDEVCAELKELAIKAGAKVHSNYNDDVSFFVAPDDSDVRNDDVCVISETVFRHAVSLENTKE